MPTKQVKAFFIKLNESEAMRNALKSSISNGTHDKPDAEQIMTNIVAFAADQDFDFSIKEYKQAIGELQTMEKRNSPIKILNP